ncbi:MAG: hypothetical protein ACI80V_003635 [Rhodothermales bacterium]|jgi:hypothetical protein
MSRKSRFPHRGLIFGVLFLVTLTTGVDAFGQSNGVVVRTNWPDVLYETQAAAMNRPGMAAAEDFADVAVLPFVDSLSLSYNAFVEADFPVIDFSLQWIAGQGGILDGELTNEFPDSLFLTLIDLHADVRVQGEKVGDLILTLDSLWLPSGDYWYQFSTNLAHWEGIFDDVDEAGARAAFESGFELAGLDILRVEFEAAEPATWVEEEVLVVRRPPRRRSIFVPEPQIWIGWNIGPDPYQRRPRASSGTRRPRGNVGREGTTTRNPDRRTRGGRDGAAASSGGSDSAASSGTTTTADSDSKRGGRGIADIIGKKKGNDDDNDDNDRDFLGPALGAAAVVGALAYFGGTIGYYGILSDAPVGFEAGRVTARGGALFHVAVSPRVIFGGPDEHLVVGFSAVFKPFVSRLHPVAGLDVWFTEDGDTYSAVPIATAGLLYRATDKLALQLGTDLSEFRTRIGLSFTFR